MIKRLRRKLIAVCMASLTAVLLVILGGVNCMSYQKVVSDADAILSLLSENRGVFPQGQPLPMEEAPPPWTWETDQTHRRIFSPETPYESRFFSVQMDADGRVTATDTRQIAAVDETVAAEYGRSVAASGKRSGFWEGYRFLRTDSEDAMQIVFLDCSRALSNFRTTLLASLLLAAVGLGAVLVLLLVLSSRIVRPVAESYEKQKRFITDAGHELKTPMTIISADADLAEMECGENQWLADIRRQTQRLTGLTNDLIYLSRMEEDQPKLQRIAFPLSDVVEEMAAAFRAPVKQQEKELVFRIQPMLSFTGDEKAIRQLVSILLDNALKYSPAGGRLSLGLEKQGRNAALTVSNTTDRPVEQEKLSHLFDRFYRGDQSRSSQTGGYGLGLSIARSIVKTHRGKIRAECPAGAVLTITVTLPL